MPFPAREQNSASRKIAPFWRFLRAGAVTALVMTGAATAHTGVGGRLPSFWLTFLLIALVMVPVTALAGRRLSLPVLGAILGLGQGFLHISFNALAGGTEALCLPTGTAGHTHHGAALVPDCPVTAVASVTHSQDLFSGGLTMTLAHVLVTILTAIILAGGESALWQLRAWLRPLIQPVQAAGLPCSSGIPMPEPVSLPRKAPITRRTAPRGPPPSHILLPAS